MRDPARRQAPGPLLSSKELIATPWLRLRRDQLRSDADGTPVDRVVLGFPDWVDVIALTDDGEIVLVEQFRHGVREIRLEFPAGTIETRETPLAAAQRELLEETGFGGEDWRPLGTAPVFPRWQDNRLHSFLALGVRQVDDPALDPGESIRCRRLPFSEFMQGVEAAEIELPSLQLAGLYLLRLKLKRSNDRRLAAVRARVGL